MEKLRGLYPVGVPEEAEAHSVLLPDMVAGPRLTIQKYSEKFLGSHP